MGLEQLQLLERRRVSLALDVLLDGVPVGTFADGSKVISGAPERASPQFPTQLREANEELFGGNRLEYADYFSAAILRGRE